jgi:hypothetical protein
MDYYAEMPMPTFDQRVNDLVLYAMEKGTNRSLDEVEDEAIYIAKETPDYSYMGYIAAGQLQERTKMDGYLGEVSN